MKKGISFYEHSEMVTKRLDEQDPLVVAVRELLSKEIKTPLEQEKKVSFDNTTGLFSIKIPKNIALKIGLNKDSNFSMILNPDSETFYKIRKTKFLINLENEKE